MQKQRKYSVKCLTLAFRGGFQTMRHTSLMRAHGLIVRPLGDSVALCPPLILTEADVAEIKARLGRAMDDFEGWVERG